MRSKKSSIIILSALLVIGIVAVVILHNNTNRHIQTDHQIPSKSPNVSKATILPNTEPTKRSDLNNHTTAKPSITETPIEPIETHTDRPTPGEDDIIESQIYILDVNEVSNWFDMDKDSILELFDLDYDITQTGADDSYTGYYYKKLGLTFIFTPSGNTLVSILCEENVLINDAHAGMNFSEIQKLLGKSKINSVYIQDYQRTDYYLEYQYNNIRYEFSSNDGEGKNSTLTILR